MGRAAKNYDAMLQDKECMIILCLAGSLFSARLIVFLEFFSKSDPLIFSSFSLVCLNQSSDSGLRTQDFVPW